MDTVISKIIEYSSKFIPEDLPPELLGVCITHMDQVTWNNEQFLDVLRRRAAMDSAVFCGLNTNKTDLKESIMRQIQRKPKSNNIDEKLFLKIFNIADGNIKIMRDTRNEVQHLQKITEVFYEEREKFTDEDQVDLIFEFQAWVLEKITDAQVRVSNSNNFTFIGPASASEAGHIANMTNQMRKIIAGIRVETCKYYKDVDSNFRKCPHCSLVWQKMEGCDGSTECGARPSTNRAHDFTRASEEMATFSFCYDYREYKFHIKKSETKKQANVTTYDNSGKGVGCGKLVQWSKMAPFRAPDLFDVTAMHSSYTGDINPLPKRAYRRFGSAYKRESKIMRDTRNEVQHLQKITEVFYEEREKFTDEDQVDLIFEFQAWVLEKITDAQVRVSNSNNFTFIGPASASEAGHIANMTNQMRKIIAGIRVETCKYYKDVDSNFRKCPHCSLVWQKMEGCDGSTECGARPSTNRAHDFTRASEEMATFSFCYDYREYKIHIKKSETKKQANVTTYDNSGKGVGCGKLVQWSKMAPFRAPDLFDVTAMHSSYTGDINPLPKRAYRRFGSAYKRESKIMRDTRNEVQHLQKITEVFYEEREKFTDEDQVDLIFEFQAWVLEKITDAQVRVSNSNNFTFIGPASASEAGHIANMTNQMRKIIAGIRVETCKYYKDVDSNFRKCPHCSLVWQKMEGCDGSTECGARPSTNRAHDFTRASEEMATFSFCYDYREYKFHIKKSETKKQANVTTYDNSGKGVGCGKLVQWSKMAPFRAPDLFDVTAMHSSYTGDINPLPKRAYRRFGSAYKRESSKLPNIQMQLGNE